MPDERLIHRTLGHSVKINKLTDFEKLVWLMYKLAADDFGVMRFSAITIQEAADWLGRKPAKTVFRALETVADVGLVQTFEDQGHTLCYQPDWQSWQKIIFPRGTKLPLPPTAQRVLCDLNTRWLFTAHPKGGKLPSWQHPDNRKKEVRDSASDVSESPPRTSPVASIGELQGCICVGVCVCDRVSVSR